MANEGLLQHAHILTWVGFCADTPAQPIRGAPQSKFTCSVDSCPYNPDTDGVDASQAMMIQESVTRRVARNLVAGGPYVTAGKCTMCGEDGDADTLAVLGNHTTRCPYRLCALIESGALVDNAGSTSSGIIADVQV